LQKVTLLAVLSGLCTKILKGLHATLTVEIGGAKVRTFVFVATLGHSRRVPQGSY